MQPNNYTLYFKNSWLTPEHFDHDFVEHAMYFGKGVSIELRSYGYNGGSHIFKAKQYFEELVSKAEKKGIKVSKSIDDLIRLSYELLERNGLINAKILPLVYTKDHEPNLVISVKKTRSFTVRENVQLDNVNKTDSVSVRTTDRLKSSEENPLFFIKHGVLYTPKVERDNSPGILRSTIIECAIAIGYPVIEKSMVVDELEGAEVVFLSDQTHEISFVQQFEKFTFTKNWRETMAMDLMMMFRQQATNEDLNYSII